MYPIKVKCIDNKNGVPLLLDAIYEVTGEIQHSYILKGISPSGWLKKRFEVISKSSIATKSSMDPEEERCWQMMRPYIPSGFCGCGIAKVDCNYHRD